MFAVIKTGGKQYRVAAQDMLKVDRLKGEPGEIVQFGEVLLVGGDSVTWFYAPNGSLAGCPLFDAGPPADAAVETSTIFTPDTGAGDGAQE